ncbi:nickel pincer cofactor biosynthesis protein LarB [Methanothrix sp.]|uniref:nickel pincer cofactor biosynthesis protein LarB n=1 Tax=Methanothrix sp. TaxID=90426 RepID=UPI0034E2FE40
MKGLRDILERFSRGEIDLEEALSGIRLLSYREVGSIAKIDHRREDRIDVPEAVLAEGKRPEDLARIALEHLESAGKVIVTRVSEEHLNALRSVELPENAEMVWYEHARAVLLKSGRIELTGGRVGILSAGTADIPVAEEARVTAEAMGCEVVTEYDVGVAGIHRLFPAMERMAGVDAMVVAAGREGTLPAVVAGLTDAPVIGLPVSTGYGAGGGGLAALLSMLQSCSVLAVVNIDAGFVAGAFAARIANRIARRKLSGARQH